MKIDLHTHILPREWPDLAARYGYGHDQFIRPEHATEDGKPCMRMIQGAPGKERLFRRVWPTCYDAGVILDACRRNGIDVQVICTVPVMFSYWAKPADTADLARLLNDDIAETCRAHPPRRDGPGFVGLGHVPLNDTDLAITELERCVRDLGFRGVQIGSHLEPNEFTGRAHDLNLDDPSLFPFWEAADALGAGVFVHPWQMMGMDQMRKYWLPWLVGMPAETCRAICFMMFGGVFDRWPDLRVCFAHAGGTFPHTIGRIEHGYNTRPDIVNLHGTRPPREYLGHFYVDTATHDPYALRVILDLIGADRIALGSDYPFPLGEHEPGKVIEALDLPGETARRLLSGTALEFLGLSPDELAR